MDVAGLRGRLREVAVFVVAFCFIGYFGFHVIQGERGLIAFARLKANIDHAQARWVKVREQRKYWELRVKMLHPTSLDPDMLDERARLMLNYAAPEDIIVLTGDLSE